MNKDEIKKKLDHLGVEYEDSMKKDELEALLPQDASDDSGGKDGIVVGKPQEVRPKELPLVIKPESGKWKNDAQAEYARTLNSYAYRNPEKWEEKKSVLIKRLKEIGETPDAIRKYEGNKGGNLSYKNKLIEE